MAALVKTKLAASASAVTAKARSTDDVEAVDCIRWGETAPENPDAVNFATAQIDAHHTDGLLSLTITSTLGDKRVMVRVDALLAELRRAGVSA